MNQDLTPLGQRMHARMKEVGIASTAELARRSDTSRALYTQLGRREDKNVHAAIFFRIAQALKCRMEWLLTGDGPVELETDARYDGLYGKSPLVEVSELDGEKIRVEDFLFEKNRTNYNCPVDCSKRTVAIKTGRKLGRYDEDAILFMDLEIVTPKTGQIVLARSKGGGVPEFYTYSTSMNKKFLKSMTEDLPDDLRFIEITDDIEILGCFVSAIVT